MLGAQWHLYNGYEWVANTLPAGRSSTHYPAAIETLASSCIYVKGLFFCHHEVSITLGYNWM